MTTTRKVFRNQDLKDGLEYGIEWGVPKGSLRVIEYKGSDRYLVTLETYEDGEIYQFIGNVKEINNWMK